MKPGYLSVTAALDHALGCVARANGCEIYLFDVPANGTKPLKIPGNEAFDRLTPEDARNLGKQLALKRPADDRFDKGSAARLGGADADAEIQFQLR